MLENQAGPTPEN